MIGSETILTISEIERLAKAGVKIELTAICPQPDPDQAVRPHFPVSLNEAFWDRWHRAHSASPVSFGEVAPYQIHAVEHKRIVYVMVSPVDQPPFIVEDEACLFPSDTLMAKLALLKPVVLR